MSHEIPKRTREVLEEDVEPDNAKIRRLEQDVKRKDIENAELKLECADAILEISLIKLNTTYKKYKKLKNRFESNLKKLTEDFENYSEEGKKDLIAKLNLDFYQINQLHIRPKDEQKNALDYIEKYINSKNPIHTCRL